MNKLNIRPHHLLCIQKYTGHGYSEEFTDHMDEIVAQLGSDTQIVINKGCDSICTACPHNENGECTSCDKVDLMDERVIRALPFEYGKTVSWGDGARVSGEMIFQTDLFEKICGSCQWYDICR